MGQSSWPTELQENQPLSDGCILLHKPVCSCTPNMGQSNWPTELQESQPLSDGCIFCASITSCLDLDHILIVHACCENGFAFPKEIVPITKCKLPGDLYGPLAAPYGLEACILAVLTTACGCDQLNHQLPVIGP